MSAYSGTRKIVATIYGDIEKTKVRTIEQTFLSFNYTIDKARESLQKQVDRYASNPYVIKVENVSEYFESFPKKS